MYVCIYPHNKFLWRPINASYLILSFDKLLPLLPSHPDSNKYPLLSLLWFLPSQNAEGYVWSLYLFIYLFICGSFPRITQKVFNWIAWHVVGWLVIIRWTFDLILGAIGALEDYNRLIIHFLALSNWKQAATTTCLHYVSQTRVSWYGHPKRHVYIMSLTPVYLEMWSTTCLHYVLTPVYQKYKIPYILV
jgi:hypothetical protein